MQPGSSSLLEFIFSAISLAHISPTMGYSPIRKTDLYHTAQKLVFVGIFFYSDYTIGFLRKPCKRVTVLLQYDHNIQCCLSNKKDMFKY